MGKTKIEWTDLPCNPIRALNKATGKMGHFCEKLSAGCTHCYASRMQPRFGTFPFLAKHREKIEYFFDAYKLEAVRKRRKPTKYFWCNMTDMFGPWVPDEWLDACFDTMAATPQHQHQLLTKRAEGMYQYLTERVAIAWPLPQCWIGVSVENREVFDRIDWLRRIPAAIRFLSLEPLLEDLGQLNLEGIHWVIVGSESGPRARPMYEDWVRSIRDQCHAAGIAFFYKQQADARGRKISLPLLDGRQHAEFPLIGGEPKPS